VEFLSMKDAKDLADSALSSSSPRIAVIKALRESWAAAREDALSSLPPEGAQIATMQDEIKNLKAELQTARARERDSLYDQANLVGRLDELRNMNQQLLQMIRDGD
jgi:hypothetical protein